MAPTPTTYCIPIDVRNFILGQFDFDASSEVKRGQIEAFILHAEGHFEDLTGTAFRPVFVTDEVHDVEATVTRHREFLDDLWFAVPRPSGLMHLPVLPFLSSRGHKIEVYEGVETVSTDGTIDWTDWLATKTQGRQSDWWLDEQSGHIYVRKTFLFRRNSLWRFTYEYGKPITTTTSSIAAGATTVPVASSYRYSTRGFFRIADEYFFHTGKSNTSLTGVIGGQLGTQQVAHASGEEVIEVPDNVRAMTAKYAAALYLENESFIAHTPEGASGVSFTERSNRWKREFDDWARMTFQRWHLV